MNNEQQGRNPSQYARDRSPTVFRVTSRVGYPRRKWKYTHVTGSVGASGDDAVDLEVEPGHAEVATVAAATAVPAARHQLCGCQLVVEVATAHDAESVGEGGCS